MNSALTAPIRTGRDAIRFEQHRGHTNDGLVFGIPVGAERGGEDGRESKQYAQIILLDRRCIRRVVWPDVPSHFPYPLFHSGPPCTHGT